MNDFLSLNRIQAAGEIHSIVQEPFGDHVHRQLEKRYSNVFCTLARLSDPNALDSMSAYIASEGRGTIVVYRIAKGMLTVLNEYFGMSMHELEQMARQLFDTHPEAKAITLPSVAAEPGPLSFPMQRFNSSEDIVIALPATPEEYLASLGRNTRAAVRRSERMLAGQTPRIDFVFHDRGDIGHERITQLVDLSRQRIADKRQVPSHTEQTIAELKRMVDAYGLSVVASKDGRVCGGVIGTHVGEHFYMHVVTHARPYDDMRLGIFCCYMSICEAIRRGAKEYHLLSGKYDYKFRFLGLQRDFEKIVIYRSLPDLFPNLSVYMETLIRGKGRMTKQRLIAWRWKWKT